MLIAATILLLCRVWVDAAVGLVLYKEFVMAVRKSGGGGNEEGAKGGGKKKKQEEDEDEEEKQKKQSTPRLKLGRTLTVMLTSQLPSGKKLRQALERADRSGSGRVSRRDFRTALEDGKLDLQVGQWIASGGVGPRRQAGRVGGWPGSDFWGACWMCWCVCMC